MGGIPDFRRVAEWNVASESYFSGHAVVQSTFFLLTGRIKSTKYIHQSISYLRNYKVVG